MRVRPKGSTGSLRSRAHQTLAPNSHRELIPAHISARAAYGQSEGCRRECRGLSAGRPNVSLELVNGRERPDRAIPVIQNEARAKLGVAASVGASLLFAVVFVLSATLDFTGNEFFGWRTLVTVATLIVFLSVTRRWSGMRTLAKRIAARPLLGLALVLTAALLGVQQWLFTWAPGQGQGLPVALGYFVLPIVLALTGRILFKERLGPWRIAAVSMAGVAVAYQIWQFGGLSWETLVVALGYPVYFALRRMVKIGGSAGLTAELMLCLPVVVALLLLDDPTLQTLRDPGSALSLVGFGVLGGVALLLYIGSSQLLPLSVFGLLSYLEPILLAAAAAFVLAEPTSPEELPTYLAIAVALLLLAVESIRRPRAPRVSGPAA